MRRSSSISCVARSRSRWTQLFANSAIGPVESANESAMMPMHWRGRPTPGEVAVVDPRPAAVGAAIGIHHPEIERRETRHGGGATRGDLVHRDATDVEVRAGGLLHDGAGPQLFVGVVRDAVIGGGLVPQVGQQRHLGHMRLQRCEHRLELTDGTRLVDAPFLAVGAARQDHHHDAHRCAWRFETWAGDFRLVSKS